MTIPKENYDTEINSSVVFNCTVYNLNTNRAISNINWYKSGHQHKLAVKDITGINANKITVQLHFHLITNQDTGSYYCTATDNRDHIHARSKSIQLLVKGKSLNNSKNNHK